MGTLHPATCSLTTHPFPALACESFRRTHAWRPANHLCAGEAAPQRRGDPPCLAPASRCARSRSSVGHRARPPFSRISTPEQGARRSRSTTARPVCGCPRLAHGGRVRRPRSGPRGGRRRPRQSLLPWEPVADAERMRSDGDAGGAGESGALPGRRRGTRPASGCPW